MDKDKELNEMMNAIKNLKTNDNNHMNIHTPEKDNSYYSKFFTNQNNQVVESNKNITENNQFENLQTQLDNYFSSVIFSKKIEEMIKQHLLQSISNQVYMNKIIEEVIKNYTNLNEDIEVFINNLIKDEVMKLIKISSVNIAKALNNI